MSFCDSNNDAFHFVMQMKDMLSDSLFETFIPYFDIFGGCILDEELSKAVAKCHKFVVVVCSEYQTDYNCLKEFDLIWNTFRRDLCTDIIVINFDSCDANDINDRRLRAFERIKKTIDFKNTKTSVLDRLKGDLGQPLCGKKVKKETDAGKKAGTYYYKDSYLNRKDADSSMNPERLTLQHEGEKQKAVRIRQNPVFERLSKPVTTCRGRYRKCYGNALE